jgi:thiol-disulfide isomerase/thioredoxin
VQSCNCDQAASPYLHALMTETRDSTAPDTRAPLKVDALRKRAIQLMVLTAVGAVLAVAFSAAVDQSSQPSLNRFDRGSLALLEFIPDPPSQPENHFAGPDGAEVSLADFRGKTVLVNLWATWCAPCVTEMPTLAALQRAFPGDQFVVLPISVDKAEDAGMAAAKLAELSGGVLPFHHDPSMDVVFPMKARGFPTSVLYGPDGREIARLAGEADWASDEAKGLITAVLAGER